MTGLALGEVGQGGAAVLQRFVGSTEAYRKALGDKTEDLLGLVGPSGSPLSIL